MSIQSTQLITMNKPKYNIGDRVYLLGSRLNLKTITGIRRTNKETIIYELDYLDFVGKEDNLYSSKEELIKSLGL